MRQMRPCERSERGADLDAEVPRADRCARLAVDAVGDLDADDVVHPWAGSPNGVEPETLRRRRASPRRGRRWRSTAASSALEHQDAGALEGGVEHGRGLGVVVEAPLAPVVEQHRDVEVVRARSVASSMPAPRRRRSARGCPASTSLRAFDHARPPRPRSSPARCPTGRPGTSAARRWPRRRPSSSISNSLPPIDAVTSA